MHMDNLPAVLEQLEAELLRRIADAWSMETFPLFLQALSDNHGDIARLLSEAGEKCYQLLESKGPISSLQRRNCLLMTHHWSERAKSFLLLWRDVVFEQQKADILKLDQEVSEKNIFDLHSQSEEALRTAALSIRSKVIESVNGGSSEKQLQEYNFQLEKQHNPWPIYREQFQQLAEQCPKILEAHQHLQQASGSIDQIRQQLMDLMAEFQEEIERLFQLSEQARRFVEDQISDRPGRIIPQLESMEEQFLVHDHLMAFTLAKDDQLSELGTKAMVPIDSRNGTVYYRDVNFKRQVDLWLDAEILPLLSEIEEWIDQLSERARMSLLNIRNRVTLLMSDQTDSKNINGNDEGISQPLLNFQKMVQLEKENVGEMVEQIQSRIEDQFRVSSLYQLDKDFLSIPLQSTINQFKLNQNALLTRGRNWINRQLTKVRELISSVETEERLSISEKVVRYIQHRTADDDNQQYSGLFLTRGYIGESFWVGRQLELARMEKMVEQWKKGFRGAVLLSGQRFAGKTLFGELIANRYFPDATVALRPNEEIELAGRRFVTGVNLEEAMGFVLKYRMRSQSLIWIDDLSLWSSRDQPLGENIRYLCKTIDDYSSKVFFLVSISNWLKYHLDLIYGIDKIFQAEINLDQMRLEDIQQAILIRHGATHKALVNEEREVIGPQSFRRIVRRIYKEAGGNIGEALLYWSHITHRLDDEQVCYQQRPIPHLPEFIHPDNAILLTTLMMEKQTNDYELRKLFGPSFRRKYGGVLQRMVNLGLLERHSNGVLEINPLVANEVGRQLHQKRYLKFFDK